MAPLILISCCLGLHVATVVINAQCLLPGGTRPGNNYDL